jgi:uncharacterized membrane protein YhaH (DUF805 family)
MKGNVIGFDPDTNTGAISGHDGKRYDFATSDWHATGRPRHGDTVDFQPAGERASQIYMVDAEYVQPGFGELYFSPNGRASRSQLWLKLVVPVIVVEIVLFVLMGICAAAGSTAGVGILYILLVIFILAVLWPHIAMLVKRAHDRDWSWAFILLFLVPIVSLWPMIELYFLRGTIGNNRFGADPVPRS